MARPQETGYDFISCVWPSISEKQFCNTKKHYSRILGKVGTVIESIKENPDVFALCFPEEIFDVIRRLRQSGMVSKEQAFKTIRVSSQSPTHTEECTLRTLRYAINVWLTVGLGPRIGHMSKPFTWAPDETLKNIATSLFESEVRGVEPVELAERQLQEDFTAASLCSYYGFSIYWTHDLTEHLSIDWQHKILTVYEDKIVAYNHVRAGTASLPVPDQLFEETIDTLNLLFPFQNEATKRILEKHDIAFYGLGLCGRPRKLLLNDYHYWRGRIANIHQVFQTPPIGIQQLLLDDEGKNFMSTFTFWVAVAAAVVALFGMGLAVVSLVYSIKQYDLGLRQYELSLVQACGDSYVRDRLPQLCSS